MFARRERPPQHKRNSSSNKTFPILFMCVWGGGCRWVIYADALFNRTCHETWCRATIGILIWFGFNNNNESAKRKIACNWTFQFTGSGFGVFVAFYSMICCIWRRHSCACVCVRLCACVLLFSFQRNCGLPLAIPISNRQMNIIERMHNIHSSCWSVGDFGLDLNLFPC